LSNELTLNENRRILTESMAGDLPSIRKQLKLSQTDLGERLGKKRQTISAIERGAVPLMWDTFLAVMVLIEQNADIITNKNLEFYQSGVRKEMYVELYRGKKIVQL
jgi:DNA-binding XRE family transcriptional regulator